MDFVEAHRDELGISVGLELVGLPRSTYYRRAVRAQEPAQAEMRDSDKQLVAAIRDVIQEHPGYGWRRILDELAETHRLIVNHKRLKRVLAGHDLGLPRFVALKRHNGPSELLQAYAGELDLVTGRDFDNLTAFSTDFTEFFVAGGAFKAWLIALLDIKSRFVAGWHVDVRRHTGSALVAWEQTLAVVMGLGRTPADVIVHSDKDSVFTSYRWLQAVLIQAGASISFSERGARNNPWIESLWSRMKLEWKSLLLEATGLEDVRRVLADWFLYYNYRRRHSALNNRSPAQFLRDQGVDVR